MGAHRSVLLLVDVQNDFCPGGALPVAEGNEIVPVLNRYVDRFVRAGLPVYFSRDWHPEGSSHFQEFGGVWPVHCVAETHGAAFHPDLRVPDSAVVLSKGTRPDEDAYSAFEARDEEGVTLSDRLKQAGCRRIYVGGLATDYCVRATVLDAVKEGFDVVVLFDAIRGVEREPGDSNRAVEEMAESGAQITTLADIEPALEQEALRTD